MRKHGGFTLVELLVCLTVLSVLALTVIPSFGDQTSRSRETVLRTNLSYLRRAVARFQEDTGRWPATLGDLARTTCPSQGFNAGGQLKSIDPEDWHGPYIVRLPEDPVSGEPFTYSVESGNRLTLTSSASGRALDGTLYTSW